MSVLNLRAYAAPIPAAADLAFEVEYAAERNGDALSANAFTAQASYALSKVAWAPTFTYRYAYFQGDDPATARHEAFDPLLPGFDDWGSWWQSEIVGEYTVANSNLASSLVRAHVDPSDSIGVGLMLYRFIFDQSVIFASGVMVRNLVFEADLYADWKLNSNFTASFILAFTNPDAATAQAFDRTRNFRYGIVFFAYSY